MGSLNEKYLREYRLLSLEQYDVCIVGAGVLGAAIARELSRYELRILWLEKDKDVATGITRGNTSIIHAGFDDTVGSVKSRYALHGVSSIEALNQQLHFGFRKCGALVVAFHESDKEKLQALRNNGIKNGVQGLELWDSNQLREHEPKLNSEASYALYAAESGVVIGPEFCLALAENAVANHVKLCLGEELRILEPTENGYALETIQHDDLKSKHYFCHYLINAAGWGAPQISQMLKSYDYELQAVKGQYLVFDRSCGQMVKHVLFPLPDKIKGKGITVCPTYHGNLILGPDAEFVNDPSDLSTCLPNLQDIYRKGQNLVPGIPKNKVIRSYAGMRPRLKMMKGNVLSPGDFLIRYQQTHCELLGIASPGLTSALPIAQELVQKLAKIWADQGSRFTAKSRFHHQRKPYIPSQRHKEFVSGKQIKTYTDLPLDDPECLVCRCEQVQSRIITEVLQRNKASAFCSVAQNLDFLKWRTRVTMGFCQGQFCKPRLKRLLAQFNNAEDITEIQGRNWDRVTPEQLRREL